MAALAYSGRYRSEPERGPQPEAVSAPTEPEKRHMPTQLPFSLGGVLKKIETAGLETDDLLLALVLFLMYRESGDKDLLIMLGAMLLA